MNPPADHGEDSYEGTGKLKGRAAIITAGDSGIGRAVSIAFAKEGANIVLSFLPEEQADADDTATVMSHEDIGELPPAEVEHTFRTNVFATFR